MLISSAYLTQQEGAAAKHNQTHQPCQDASDKFGLPVYAGLEQPSHSSAVDAEVQTLFPWISTLMCWLNVVDT